MKISISPLGIRWSCRSAQKWETVIDGLTITTRQEDKSRKWVVICEDKELHLCQSLDLARKWVDGYFVAEMWTVVFRHGGWRVSLDIDGPDRVSQYCALEMQRRKSLQVDNVQELVLNW